MHDFNHSTHFLSLFVAVLFAGSVVCPRSRLQQTFGHRSRERLSSRLYKMAISAIRLSDFPQVPSLQSLAAFLIVDTTWLREEQPLTCCSFVGVAYRVAQVLGKLKTSIIPRIRNLTSFLGLHQDPLEYGNISGSECQLRRNLWWTLVAIDAQVAFAAGLPPLMPNGGHNVKSINAALPPGPHEDSSSCLAQKGNDPLVSLFIAGKYLFYERSSAFLLAIHKRTLDEHDLEKILEITDSIETDLQRYKSEISAREQVSNGENNSNGCASPESAASPYFPELAEMVLSMYAAKPYAIMYGPLRRHGLLNLLRQRRPKFVTPIHIR